MSSDNLVNIQFYFDKALIDFHNKDYSSAINNLKLFLQKNVKNPDAFHLLAVSTALNGNHTDSLKYYIEALKLRSDDAQILSNYASSLSKVGDNKNALLYQKKCLEIDSNNFEYFYNCANIYCELELYEDSLNFYQKSIDLNPLFPLSFNNFVVSSFIIRLIIFSIYVGSFFPLS